MGRFRRLEIDEASMIKNPFVNGIGFEIKANKLQDKKSYIRDEDIWLKKEFLVEADKSAKVYISSECRKFVSSLSVSSRALFLWFIYESKAGKDWVEVNIQRCLKENDISLNTYKKAIIDLCENSIICPHFKYRNVYWTNPLLFFNGNRMDKYPQCVKVLK